jgi:hypothetical protein
VSSAVEVGCTLPRAKWNERFYPHTQILPNGQEAKGAETDEERKNRHRSALILSGATGGAGVTQFQHLDRSEALKYGVVGYLSTYALPLSALGAWNQNAEAIVNNPGIWAAVGAVVAARTFNNAMGYEGWTEKAVRLAAKGVHSAGQRISNGVHWLGSKLSRASLESDSNEPIDYDQDGAPLPPAAQPFHPAT